MSQEEEDKRLYDKYIQLVPKNIYRVLAFDASLEPGDVVFLRGSKMFAQWDNSYLAVAGHYLIALRPRTGQLFPLKYKKELDEYYGYTAKAQQHDVHKHKAGKYNDPILDQREDTHGDFEDNAGTVCALIRAMGDSIQDMPEVQNVALSQVALKIARIVNGDNLSDEHWKDIAGYANLVVHWLNKAGVLITPSSVGVKACDDGERDPL